MADRRPGVDIWVGAGGSAPMARLLPKSSWKW